MKISGIVVVAIAFLMLPASYSCGATSLVAFDNLSPTTPYYSNSGSWFGTRPINPSLTVVIANGFTPSTTGYLDELWLGIFKYSSVNKNELMLSVYTDNNRSLGTRLWRQSFTDVIEAYGTLTHVSSLATSNSPKLLAGHSYWLTAESPDDGETYHAWYASNTGDRGNWGRAYNDDWQYESSHWRHAMRVGLSTVPEPGTLPVLLGASAFGLILAGRRRGSWAGESG